MRVGGPYDTQGPVAQLARALDANQMGPGTRLRDDTFHRYFFMFFITDIPHQNMPL